MLGTSLCLAIPEAFSCDFFFFPFQCVVRDIWHILYCIQQLCFIIIIKWSNKKVVYYTFNIIYKLHRCRLHCLSHSYTLNLYWKMNGAIIGQDFCNYNPLVYISLFSKLTVKAANF